MKNWLAAGLTAFLSTAATAQPWTEAEMQSRTAEIATRYLAVWSSDAWNSVEGVPYVYGPRVRFYGQDFSQADLMAEKRRAIRQWPSRRYVHRPGTLRVQCNMPRQRCVASSTTDYSVSNPARGTAKSGSALFDLGVSFAGPKPVILFEGGSIGRRRV
ncbi:hypothetical protein [uncultured Enterovirga sp.]|uniref:hypothetical protein n=1 Tax=uncultured Enterovirga sp. TaxID=2026352 RepID=UPI0035CA3507